MRIAVCEDEALFRSRIVKTIENYYHSLDVVVDSFSSGEELLKRYEINKQQGQRDCYDILFLDIEMKELDGFETVKKLRAYGGGELIIFLTSHTELAMQGYEVEAFRFLGKPVEPNKLYETLKEIEKRMLKKEYLVLHTTEQDYRVLVSSILYIESMKNDVYYYVLEREHDTHVKCYKVRGKITEIEKQLQSYGFFRCHKSYLVGLLHIISYGNRELTITTGIHLPVSRGKIQLLKQALIREVKS